MIKDIQFPEVTDVAMAVARDTNDHNEEHWYAFLINLKNEPLTGILVASTGYGEINQERRKTSTLRHYFEALDPQSYLRIEPIMEEVLPLNNEYWLSFYLNGKIYDKQYVFLPDSIRPENFSLLPLLNKKGVMIK